MLRHVNPHATEPLQTEAQVCTPAAVRENADTSITPHEKKENLSVMRASAPCEEEAFIHLFSLFSKTNRGHDYAATLIALCLLQLNFKLRGFILPTFMVTSKPALCLPSPPAKSDYLHFLQTT